MHIPNRSLDLPRRTFLRGLGACIGLPLLECMVPSVTKAASRLGGAPRRLVAYLAAVPALQLPQLEFTADPLYAGGHTPGARSAG